MVIHFVEKVFNFIIKYFISNLKLYYYYYYYYYYFTSFSNLKGMLNITLVKKIYKNDKLVIIYNSVMRQELYFTMASSNRG